MNQVFKQYGRFYVPHLFLVGLMLVLGVFSPTIARAAELNSQSESVIVTASVRLSDYFADMLSQNSEAKITSREVGGWFGPAQQYSAAEPLTIDLHLVGPKRQLALKNNLARLRIVDKSGAERLALEQKADRDGIVRFTVVPLPEMAGQTYTAAFTDLSYERPIELKTTLDFSLKELPKRKSGKVVQVAEPAAPVEPTLTGSRGSLPELLPASSSGMINNRYDQSSEGHQHQESGATVFSQSRPVSDALYPDSRGSP